MKKLIITTAAILFAGYISPAQETNYSERLNFNEEKKPVISKEISFNIRGNYSRPVKKETLVKAKLLRDIIPHYPINWIDHYISVEVSVTSHGKVLNATSKDEDLSPDQIRILKSAELASEIGIKVYHKAENPVTAILEDHIMSVEMTVVPEVEAEFSGGNQQIRNYLKEAVINKISSIEVEPFILSFSINEDGEAEKILITKSTGNPELDKFLIDTITNMPKWKPAQDSIGKSVRQDFVFEVENDGC